MKHALHMSSRKCKLKQYNSTHLVEGPKSRTLVTPNAGEEVEQQELSYIAGGTAKWYSHFGRQFGGFYKTKHTLTI